MKLTVLIHQFNKRFCLFYVLSGRSFSLQIVATCADRQAFHSVIKGSLECVVPFVRISRHYDLALFGHEADKQAVSLFLNWFRQLALYGKVSPEDYAKLDTVYRTKEEVQTMLVTALEQERREIYRKGQIEGEAAGLAKGVEAQRQTLLQFIHWRFQTNAEEQKQLAQQLAQINDLQQLTQLSEHFLQATTLGEFTKRIAAQLPSHNPQ